MPVTIPVCSNKHQTSIKNDHTAGNATPETAPITLSKPFIDKIAIVVIPADEQEAHEIHNAICVAFMDKDDFQTAGHAEKQGYSDARWISNPNNVHRTLIQYRSLDKKTKLVRLEFNPRKIGEEGLTYVAAQLTSVFPDGWEYVVENGHVTRLDVAVDISGIRMNNALCLSKQGISSTIFAVDGIVQYVKLGKKGDQTLLYSRKQKRLSKGQGWSGPSVIRIERRLKNPSFYGLANLSKLQNPFLGLSMVVNLPGPSSNMKANEWLIFCDSVLVRGVHAALALLPKARRSAYRAHLKANSMLWWEPDKLWTHWPEHVAQSKLCCFCP